MVILTGDFNARSPLLWIEEVSENLAGKQLSNLANFNIFEQLISEPTHLPRDDIATCIDLILTNDPFAFIDYGVLPSLDPKCKHQVIHGKFYFHIPSPLKYIGKSLGIWKK